MLDINTIARGPAKTVVLKGRIDGLSSPDIENELTRLASGGDRRLVIDFSSVSYISSAGLRVFLAIQKMLKKIGGELLLLALPTPVLEVFRISGFEAIFRIFRDEADLAAHAALSADAAGTAGGADISRRPVSGHRGRAFLIGDQDLLQSGLYGESNVVEVSAPDIRFGAGVAALGEGYEEYKHLFGESVVIDGSFFSYPATKRSAVDYMLKEQVQPSLKYHFLYGFGFGGGPSTVLGFSERDGFISLGEMIGAAKEASGTDLFGVVLVAESAGISGMNLKRSPLADNRPATGGIFDQRNFADWLDFPLEPSHAHHIVAAAGIAVRAGGSRSGLRKPVLAEGADFHVHGVVMEKAFLGKDPGDFESEVDRVITELRPLKVQHLLGASRFKSGLLAVIDLEED
jgi:anti-anti-sigma factor